MKRPHTQLFALMSVDGKISTGASSDFDFDIDLSRIPGTASGLEQYYDIESKTDVWTLTTGATMQKVFQLTGDQKPKRVPVNNIVVDSQHLTEPCIKWMSEKYAHVAVALPDGAHNDKRYSYLWRKYINVHVVQYPYRCLDVLLDKVGEVYKCDCLTLQGGSTLNSSLIALRLVDEVHLVVAPLLVGGFDTPSLIGGTPLIRKEALRKVSALKLKTVNPLKHNYLELVYEVDYSLTTGVKNLEL